MRTLGVEEEMLLVDVHNGRPRSVSGQLLVRAARRQPEVAGAGVHGAVEGEFQQQQIETHTAPVADLDDTAHRGQAVALRGRRGRPRDRVERRRARHLAAARAPGRGEVDRGMPGWRTATSSRPAST